MKSSAPPVTDPQAGVLDSAPDAEASSVTDPSSSWSPDFRLLSLNDQIVEIHDHVTRLRAEVATLRAELRAEQEEPRNPYLPDRGDMTGRK